MAQSPKEVVMEWCNSHDGGDPLETLRKVLADDVTVDLAGAGSWIGKDEVMQHEITGYGNLEAITVTPRLCAAEGDAVFLELDVNTRPHGGVDYPHQYCHSFIVRDGKIHAWRRWTTFK